MTVDDADSVYYGLNALPWRATEWVTNAATERWRTWDRPGPTVVEPDEEADASSPMAQTLALFGRVVCAVSSNQSAGWDPEEIRARILGQR